MVNFAPMSSDEVTAWLAESVDGFARDLNVSIGLSRHDALARARSILDEVVPEGEKTPGHYFCWIMDDTHRVGRIWYGPQDGNPSSVHIWDVEVVPLFRGRGYGGAALDRVADIARGQGLTGVSLNVFTSNPEARRLYERKGFVATAATGGQTPMTLDLHTGN